MKNTTIKYIILVACFLCSTNLLRAQLSGGESFLQGLFLELGIDNSGVYGTDGLGNLPAVGQQGVPYSPNNNNGLGFVSDPGMDGFNMGTPAFCGDFVTPGSPAEGFSVSFNNPGGFCQSSTNQNPAPSQISGANQSLIYNPATGIIENIWAGASTSGIGLTQTTTLNENDLFFVTTVEVCNNSTMVMENVTYLRNFDPDNDREVCGSFSTTNCVENGCTSMVEATGVCAGCYMAIETSDPRATAYSLSLIHI